MSAIGEFLRKLRAETGLTQEEIANELGISHNTYVRYENGMRKPTADNASRIAEFFNISVSELLAGKRNDPDAEPVPRQLTKKEIKRALWGDEDATDEDLEDVKRYANFIRASRNRGSL